MHASHTDFLIGDRFDELFRKAALLTARTERGLDCVLRLHEQLSLLERLKVDDLIRCGASSFLVDKIEHSLDVRARVAGASLYTHLFFVPVDVVDK